MKQNAFAGFMASFFKFGDYFVLLLYVNLLWLVFTLLGGIIFGWAPSTAAMFAVMRGKLMEKPDSVFSIFWHTYRKEFWKTNGLNLIIILVAFILYTNIQYFEVESAALYAAVRYIMIGIIILGGMMILYMFPLIVHYEAKLFHHMKSALLLIVYKPIRTLFAAASCAVVSQFLFVFPVFVPFLGLSLFALVIMTITYYTFQHVEEKNERLQESQA